MTVRKEPMTAAAANTPECQETEPAGHVSYPHLPGRLYDCPACEAECHCTPGDAKCVYDGEHNGMADA